MLARPTIHTPLLGISMVLGFFFFLSEHALNGAVDTAIVVPTWSLPADDEIQRQFREYYEAAVPRPDELDQAIRQWQRTKQRGHTPLDALVDAASVLDDDVKQLQEFCQQPFQREALPNFEVLSDTTRPDWLIANLKLYYGRWLANSALYNEAYELLRPLAESDVVDPATLLFYKAVAAHRLMEQEQCLELVKQLNSNPDQLPERYATVARLMAADLKTLQPDSLDEIARLMGNIQTRLGHGRAGRRVRTEEDEVIEKLDKMIEKLEEQASAMAAAMAGNGGSQSQQPTPMQDSLPGGGTGPGNVDPKQLGAQSDWGNLPPKEREAALQRLSKDLPSHYREVIEGYFRKLGQDGS